jgi:nondiscriminating glutamyl-tRNA synthetase
MSIRIRFAPSPTGILHVGNARTALFNWLFARKEKGSFILRIEDTDLARSTQESIDGIVKDLQWLGLDWDEGYAKGGQYGPYRQSEKLAQYWAAAEKLVAAGKAYYCYENEQELESDREDWLKEHLKKRHPHRNLDAAQRAHFEAEGRKPSIRFATDDLKGEVVYQDLVRGDVKVDLSEIRDFNIIKSDGMPMYNFACVIDDQAMAISHVIRGEDGISNTPRQILLYQALGIEPPRFGHVSFILGPDGQKLSKRHGSSSVAELRAAGYLPEAVVNYLGLLGMGGHGEGEEIYSLEMLASMFSPDHLIKKSAIFDYGKLDFLNAHYIRLKSGAELHALCAPFLGDFQAPSDAWLDEALDLLKANARHLGEVAEPLKALVDEDFFLGPNAKAEAAAFPSAKGAVEALKSSFLGEGFPKSAEEAKARYKSAQKASNIKGKDFFMPTRIALTGSAHGPEIVRMIPLIGESRCLKRLDAFLKAL